MLKHKLGILILLFCYINFNKRQHDRDFFDILMIFGRCRNDLEITGT